MVPQDTGSSQKKAEQQKLAYSPPKLMEHGTVEQLTEAIGGTNTDGFGGSTIG